MLDSQGVVRPASSLGNFWSFGFSDTYVDLFGHRAEQLCLQPWLKAVWAFVYKNIPKLTRSLEVKQYTRRLKGRIGFCTDGSLQGSLSSDGIRMA